MRKKLLCVLLSLLLAFGQTLAICAEQTQQSVTPGQTQIPTQIPVETIEPEPSSTGAENTESVQPAESPGQTEQGSDLESATPEPEAATPTPEISPPIQPQSPAPTDQGWLPEIQPAETQGPVTPEQNRAIEDHDDGWKQATPITAPFYQIYSKDVETRWFLLTVPEGSWALATTGNGAVRKTVYKANEDGSIGDWITYTGETFCDSWAIPSGQCYIRLEVLYDNNYGFLVFNTENTFDYYPHTGEYEMENAAYCSWEYDGMSMGFELIDALGASGGKALRAFGHKADGSILSDNPEELDIPPTAVVVMRSPDDHMLHDIWLRGRANDTSQDTYWFSLPWGNIGGTECVSGTIEVGSKDQPWTWSHVAFRTLHDTYYLLSFWPREEGAIFDRLETVSTTPPGQRPHDTPDHLDKQPIEMEADTARPLEKDGTTATFRSVTDSTASERAGLEAWVSGETDMLAEVSSEDSAVLNYQITLAEQRECDIWVRTRNVTDSTDSVWARIGWGNDYTNCYLTKGEGWTWTKLMHTTLAKGTNTLGLIPRERGAVFDKIVVSYDPNYVPSDNMVNGYAAFEMEDSSITPYSNQGQEATFQYQTDGNASGGHSLRAWAQGGTLQEAPPANATPTLQYEFDVDQIDLYNIWVRAISDSERTNSVWMAIDNGPYQEVHFDPNTGSEVGQYRWVRFGTPELWYGTHTIKIIPRESDGVYDKLIVTRQKSYTDNPQFMLNGSFRTEAELGTIQEYDQYQGMQIGYEPVSAAGASGGVALNATLSGTEADKVEDPTEIDPILTLTIDAERDGTYSIWGRVQAKSTAEDSIWYKLDNGEYRQIALPVNSSDNPSQWQWVKLDTVSLGRGEHTIGLTPREIGCLIDQVAVGLGESFEPGGDDPLYEPPPIREAGVEYEQNTSSYTDLTPPSIQAVRVEVLNFSKGIYRLTITDEDYTLDSRGTPFFFWSAEEGTFSEESADYKSVVFTADPGTAGQKVRVTVGIGDGLGQVSYRSLSLDGSEEQ